MAAIAPSWPMMWLSFLSAVVFKARIIEHCSPSKAPNDTNEIPRSKPAKSTQL